MAPRLTITRLDEAKAEAQATADLPTETMENPAENPAADGDGELRLPVFARGDCWARRKGHIPPAGPIRFRSDPHRGKPHYAVIFAHLEGQHRASRGKPLPVNMPFTEAEYDAAALAAYNLPMGENLPDQIRRERAAGASKEDNR